MAEESKKIDFKSTVIDKKACSITLDVEVSPETAVKKIDEAFIGLQRQVRLDGFRQGKTPMNIIREKYAEEAKSRAVENVIKGTILNALEKEKFLPIDFPVVDEFDYEVGNTLKYRFTAECHPSIEVKDYKAIPVKKEIFKVTGASLAQSLDALRERNAKLIPSKSGVIGEKSFAVVDYEAFDNGIALPEISAKNHMLDFGYDNTVKGFKEALKGAKIGDERDVKAEYPADYPNKTLAGKTIMFKTTVQEIKEKELPDLNDDFAKDMGVENLEDLKNKAKEAIEAEEKRRQDIDVEKQIIEYLIKKNVFEVPQSLVERQKENLVKKMKEYMQKQGTQKDYIDKQVELGQQKFKEEAEKNVRLSYILNALYINEKLQITEHDLDEEKNRMKTVNPGRDEAVEKYFEENKENIIISLKETKLFKFLLDNAKIEEVVKDMPLKEDK
ncbi:MAG: trigger factor [Endomicrobium sp.]|jgi:trigger factor|nr:trigger factor [Endomicrobium sp.]